MKTILSKSERWYNHPQRPCKGKAKYVDLKGVSNDRVAEMVESCSYCPVLRECRLDALSIPSTEFWGVQAGMVGRRG